MANTGNKVLSDQMIAIGQNTKTNTSKITTSITGLTEVFGVLSFII